MSADSRSPRSGKTGNGLLLFDFDGVLVESLDVYERVVKKALARIGSPIVKSREDFLDLFDGNFYESLAQKGVDVQVLARTIRMTPEDHAQILPHGAMMPVLRALHERRVLAVLSSNAARTIERALARFGWDGCFDRVLGSEAGFSKTEKFSRALEIYGMEPAEVSYVCDTVGDIREARDAGIRTVAVTWGWHSRERLAAAHPDRLIDVPEKLLTL
jgi:phosphoglycolate phosphatase